MTMKIIDMDRNIKYYSISEEKVSTIRRFLSIKIGEFGSIDEILRDADVYVDLDANVAIEDF